MVSVAFAGKGQDIDAGVKMIHIARDTTSKVVSKSVSKNGGHSSFRGIVRMGKSAANAKSHVECNSLLLDGDSSADTFPSMAVANDTAQATHEAAVSRLDEEKLFYMRTRGFTADLARQMLVHGFVEPFSRELPMEYAVEMNRLLSLQLGEEK
jgi:Fe-S cluster assembly protein SufB